MTSPVGSGPERVARQQIDQFLTEAGWIVQGREGINLSGGPGIAIREFKLADGFGYADYLLFVDGHAVGAVEAKPQGYTLGGVERRFSSTRRGSRPGSTPRLGPCPSCT
jgi:type I restriction enzyme R subunit